MLKWCGKLGLIAVAKILLVEDDKDIRYTVASTLTKEHFTVEEAADGRQALELLGSFEYDVIILDVNMPHVSGVQVCKQFRSRGGKTPVLMLTAQSQIEHKEEGLDAGADDYLTKPFDIRELMARIRALLRRSSSVAESNVLTAGNLTLNVKSRMLERNGENVYLLPRDFELIEFLIRYPNQIFSADSLLERVWHNDKDVSQDALRSSIKRLRQKIGDTECKIIENIPKVGYKLSPDAEGKKTVSKSSD
jgi:DNA-binding response OmpR family regulator